MPRKRHSVERDGIKVKVIKGSGTKIRKVTIKEKKLF